MTYSLLPKLKAVLKGRHFDTRDDIIEKSLLALKSIPKEAHKNCFDNWEKRWRWCVEARGITFKRFYKRLPDLTTFIVDRMTKTKNDTAKKMRERAKMEEQARHSNETTKQFLPNKRYLRKKRRPKGPPQTR
ncbi:hypothetical protein LAZ67_16001711 [Cordylochernes scorpioides]|uniref:Uncharacterized protein n=1 Tax=Cordylochernes scorpioides TaxID=51811 RepID=A0ABY6LBS6_9ARAC|nr:hypothetical protein LAZ67_16001711 [Cordylochernes scorpioides]